MRIVCALVALVMALSAPLSADAQQRGGGAHGGGPAPAARPAPVTGQAPMARPAPAARPAAPAREPGGGFNVGNEFQRPNLPVPVTRPAPATRPVPLPNNFGNVRPPGNARLPVRQPPGGFPSRPPRPPRGYAPPRPPHAIISNPGYHGPAWGWNGGVRWNPAPGYWGGGFWGGFAIAAMSAFVYGSIVDAQNQTLYSYQVAPGSPGAQLLQNYQLTQTNCDQDDLVIIYGPQDSLICAYPNDLVGPGTYSVDPTGLTLSSQ